MCFNNYTPISILPALSEIMETIVCNRLENTWRNISFYINNNMDFALNNLLYTHYCIYSKVLQMQMTRLLKMLHWLYSLVYPKHLTLLIMIFCYVNCVIMELEASLINDSEVASLIVNSTFK